MSLRALAVSSLLLCLLLATPAVAIGGGPPVSSAGSSVSFDASSAAEARWTGAAPARPASAIESCDESLRGFMGRNTLRPSVRRAALARCEAERASDDAEPVGP